MTARTATPVRKGMILCAGLGTRLLPITKNCPKPLVPVLGLPNVLHNLFLLKSAGIKQVILNLHYLGDAIQSALGDGSRFGMQLAYSSEPKLLGTGGGVKKAEPFFENETFVLMNCDFVTNIEIAAVVDRHRQNRALATMVLVNLNDSEREAGYPAVGVTADGHLCQLPKLKTAAPERQGIFTGIHVLEPSALAVLKAEPSGINEILYPHFMRVMPSRVYGNFVEGVYWRDTGDLPFLWSTSMALLSELLQHPSGVLAQTIGDFGGYEQRHAGVWVKNGEPMPKGVLLKAPVVLGQGCNISSGVTLGPSVVVGDDCHIEAGATVTQSVVMDGACIHRGAQVVSGVHYNSETFPGQLTKNL